MKSTQRKEKTKPEHYLHCVFMNDDDDDNKRGIDAVSKNESS
jgi:hypothetical protein